MPSKFLVATFTNPETLLAAVRASRRKFSDL